MNRYLPMAGIALSLLVLAGAPAIAGPLTVVDFNGDLPGLPPSTGGPNQPTFLQVSAGTSILVQSSANGIPTQPAVLTADAPSEFASMFVNFAPIASGVLHVESLVSFNRFIDAFFLQSAVTGSLGVVTRLDALFDGRIVDDNSRTTIGFYVPNAPFVVSMDIDMSSKTWSAAIDNELNGFLDDPIVSGLPFENPPAVLPSVGTVVASLDIFPTFFLGGSVAYDDIKVSRASVPQPTTLFLLGAGIAVLGGAGWGLSGSAASKKRNRHDQ